MLRACYDADAPTPEAATARFRDRTEQAELLTGLLAGSDRGLAPHGPTLPLGASPLCGRCGGADRCDRSLFFCSLVAGLVGAMVGMGEKSPAKTLACHRR
jgi:hypothetical protein